MNEEQHRPSLAEAAASWVPPWERAAVAPPATESVAPDEPAPEPAAPELAVPELAVPELAAPDEATPEPAAPELAAPDEATPEPAAPEPAAPESVALEVPEPEPEVAPQPEPEPPPQPGAPVLLEPETEAAAPMDPDTLRGALEAILLVVDEPTGEAALAEVLGQPTDLVAATLADLAEEYARAGRGFELRRAAGGWRFYTRAEFASYVERFVLDGQQVRLTQAALETLAVVAYKQPVTRSRISAIRGVNCDGVVRTLVSRGLIEECGTEPESGAFLYRTTPLFLERLGLDSVAELPPLAPFLPEDVDEIADVQR